MKYCTGCNVTYYDTARFCGRCGGAIQPTVPAPEQLSQHTILEYIARLRQSDADYQFSADVYFWGESEKANRKIQNAAKAYAVLKPGEFPLFCLDITVFGGAEDGMLVTTHGIHIHEVFGDYRFFAYPEITAMNLNDRTFTIQGVKLNAAGIDKNLLQIALELLYLMKDTFYPPQPATAAVQPQASAPVPTNRSATAQRTNRTSAPPQEMASSSAALDLNAADAQALSTLFFVNIILAQKIVNIRSTQGSFTSMEDFFTRIHTTEAAAAEIRQKCYVTANTNPGGRFIDF